MARKTLANGTQSAMPVHKDTKAAPPLSTAATQLVERHADPAAQKQPQSRAAFSQLLVELLQCPEAIENDVQSNYKLISVVAEAGLEASADAGEDPFARRAVGEATEIVACLDVIDIAVQRTPQVLLYAGSGSEGSGLEICLLLLPKLLSLVTQVEYPTLLASLRRLLSTLLVSLSKSIHHRKAFDILKRIFQACVDDTLSALEQLEDVPLSSSKLDLVLPSPEARLLVGTDTPQPVALRQSYQVRVTYVSHAVDIAILLIEGVWHGLEITFINSTNPSASSQEQETWIMTSIARCHRIRVLHEDRNIGGQISQIEAVYLELVRSFTVFVENNGCVIILQKSAMLLTACVASSLSKAGWLTELVLQEQIDKCSKAIMHLLTRFSTVMEDARFTLLPLLLKLDDKTAEAITVENDSTNTRRQLTEALRSGKLLLDTTNHHSSCSPIQQGSRRVSIPRPWKRQKRNEPSERGSELKAVPTLDELCALFGNWSRTDLSGLGKAAPGMFDCFSVEQRHAALDLLRKIACAGAEHHAQAPQLKKFAHKCDFCDATHKGSFVWDDRHWVCFYDIIVGLIDSPVLQSSKDHRVAIMMAIRTFLNHTSVPGHLDLSSSVTAKWCLQSVRSSLRELRIAAAHTLPLLLRTDHRIEIGLCRRNRLIALEFLRQLTEANDPRHAETLIHTLGRISCVCDHEETNLILLCLVEYLGHKNTLVCALAHLELKNIGQAASTSMQDMFKPFWRTIGITVVKDLLSCPQKSQQLAELLGLSVNQFLLLTQAETLPYLVLWRKRDVLQRLAVARDDGSTVLDLCLHRRNLPGILSLLLIQEPTQLEATVRSILSLASPDFCEIDVSNLLKSDILGVACEVLKMIGDADGSEKAKVLEGFRQFAAIVERRGAPTKGVSTQQNLMPVFFETHALGIMASFSDVIDSPNEAVTEKKRCLCAVEQMIEVARQNVKVALPQVRACLQSALGTVELRDQAVLGWLALMQVVELDEELAILIEHTFTALVQFWDSVSPSTQQRAYDATVAVSKKHNALLLDIVCLIPSLNSIPLMSKYESHFAKVKNEMDTGHRLKAFSKRCRNENAALVLQALRELLPYLHTVQQWIHESALTEQPHQTIPDLIRSLLDACVRFREGHEEILDLCGNCLGVIGCLDPSRLELTRDVHDKIVQLSNFDQANEAIEFVTYLLGNVLVSAFHSVSNPRAQGFLAYVMQELLRFCGFDGETSLPHRMNEDEASDETRRRWLQMPESVRNTLTPFLTSKYVLKTLAAKPQGDSPYPIYSPKMQHGTWLRPFVSDLLQRPQGENAKMIFAVLSRIIRGYDISIASFLLRFAVANIVIGGTATEARNIALELLHVLQCPTNDLSQSDFVNLKLCSENVFQVLEHLSKWVQEKKRAVNGARQRVEKLFERERNEERDKERKAILESEELYAAGQIKKVEDVLSAIPADAIARRAVVCGSYARALFHWEQYVHQQEEATKVAGSQKNPPDKEQLYQRLQEIYSQIDEPDGISGISTFLQVVNPQQEIVEHRDAERWAAAQTWYEMRLDDTPEESPKAVDLQIGILECLQGAGQFGTVFERGKNLGNALQSNRRVLSLISEAAWRSDRLQELLEIHTDVSASTLGTADFNIGIGTALFSLRDEDEPSFLASLSKLRLIVAQSLSPSTTVSLQACHDQILKFHALSEVEILSRATISSHEFQGPLQPVMDRRLSIVGSSLHDKQYLLGLRRAVMKSSLEPFANGQIAASWMQTAKLARKGANLNIAYNAVLQAKYLGDESALIEQARLLWQEGNHRKAIQSLEGVIASNALNARANTSATGAAGESSLMVTTATSRKEEQSLVQAKAQLLLAKWLDKAGQTQSSILQRKYQDAVKSFGRWEKGYYYLGKYYNKLLESEKALPTAKQNYDYLSGDSAKLVIENYLRSLMFGCKYLFESVPKLLTLWLDFGNESTRSISREVPDDIRRLASESRPKFLDQINKQFKKYSDRLPAYMFYSALAQMITRISHSNVKVQEILAATIVKVVAAYPQQGLWPLLATGRSSAADRATRGLALLNKLKEKGKHIRNEGQTVELRSLVTQGQRLTEQLIHTCEMHIGEKNASMMSLTRDFGFNPKVVPCGLVIPLTKTLNASLPTTSEVNKHKAFPATREALTFTSFTDEVLVLSSLQKPRRVTVRGSDGNKYALMCKPKDDLRKDQRLMEFNAMINRALKKDSESSKRRLHFRTYAVTPLNEAHGLIEWVEGLKPMRDIIISSYRSRDIKADYQLLRMLLDQACAEPDGHRIFTKQILPMYPPVLHEWFADTFPDPEAWFAARLHYTRSCAVTSITGWALGLGDRHGENVLLVEKDGGVFHVDFNCLFEKGLTFDKPEKVPFRLTHNMVNAFGAYGVEGPFRRSAECAMSVMRGNEDTLLTILETFVYDPTTDFVGMSRKRVTKGVPETPKEILDSVRDKLKGLIRGESVPLSVEGHVDALIRQATDPANLCAMYLGWCAFF